MCPRAMSPSHYQAAQANLQTMKECTIIKLIQHLSEFHPIILTLNKNSLLRQSGLLDLQVIAHKFLIHRNDIWNKYL